ncbi:hypothetical protein [Kitasatospora sp. NPDC008115]|uniref:hypothetical protein n=1 Tax=Kitasatospora sp. NPDC008115 TaxID=3364022 RepID=UPI0036E07248
MSNPFVLSTPGGDGPRVFELTPSATAGQLDAKQVWAPAKADEVESTHYTDAKLVRSATWGEVVLAARWGKDPRVLVIEYATGKVVWRSDPKLGDLGGGVHSATLLPGDHVVVHAPKADANDGDHLIFIPHDRPEAMVPYDLVDSHGSVWVESAKASGGGYLWAIGRTTLARDTKDRGTCVLRQYGLGKDLKCPLQYVNQFTLVAEPLELGYMEQPGWNESPHDIARADENTLWIATESRVVAFDLDTLETPPEPVPRTTFQSEVEPKDPLTEHPSATNLKSLSVHGDTVLYAQTMGKASDTSTIGLVTQGRKQTAHLDEPFYKARLVTPGQA